MCQQSRLRSRAGALWLRYREQLVGRDPRTNRAVPAGHSTMRESAIVADPSPKWSTGLWLEYILDPPACSLSWRSRPVVTSALERSVIDRRGVTPAHSP
jgi:hypothetical protein